MQLLRHLKLFPNLLVGHSFGGKVILSMVEQFGNKLPRPVTAFVLDTVPGDVNAGVLSDGQVVDHPRDLIHALLKMPTPLPSRQAAVEALQVCCSASL
jgi:pimeloyl-ACP methyl ester carboxylesterase